MTSAYTCADYIIRHYNEIKKQKYEQSREVKKVADYFIVKYERFNQKYPLNIQRLCYLVFLAKIEHYRNLNDRARYYDDSLVTNNGSIYATTGGPAFKELLNSYNYTQIGEPIPYFLRNVPESEYNCKINKNKYCGPVLTFEEEDLELLNEYSQKIFNKTRNISTDNLCKGFLEIKKLNPKNLTAFSDENKLEEKILSEVARTPKLYNTLYKYQDKKADAKAPEPTSE